MWSSLSDRYKKIATLLGLALTLSAVSLASYAYADYFSWSQISNISYTSGFSDIAASDDGTYSIAVRSDNDDSVYVSSDSGQSYGAVSFAYGGTASASSVAISGDGQCMTVGTEAGSFDSRDNGGTWTNGLSIADVTDVAMSHDCRYQVGISPGGGVYLSSNYGAYGGWVYKSGSIPSQYRLGFSTVDITDDGLKLVIAGSGTQPYISTNGGTSWASSGPAVRWSSVAMSGDGSKIVGVTNNDYVYVSSDGGATWNSIASLGVRHWSSVSMSTNGSVIAVSASDNGVVDVYTSTDGGATWEPESSGPHGIDTRGVAITGLGGKLFAASSNSYLFMGADITPPHVVGVTATNPSGSYTVGTSSDTIINIQVELSEPASGSNLSIGLNNGVSVACSAYGSTGRFLSCPYTVGSGQDIDPLNVSSYTGLQEVYDAEGNPLSDPTVVIPTYALADKGIAIDTVAPSSPTQPLSLTPATDTGSSSSDGLTSIQNPAVTASCSPSGDLMKVYVDGSYDTSATCNGTSFTVSLATSYPAGSHSLKYTQVDAAGNESGFSSTTAIVIDTAAPGSSSIASAVLSDSSARIDWNTDEYATAVVRYGTVTGSYVLSSSTATSSFALSHSIILSGLQASTAYYYVVVSTDAAGNVSTSTEKTFMTDRVPVPGDADTAPQTPSASGGYSGSYSFLPYYVPTKVVLEPGQAGSSQSIPVISGSLVNDPIQLILYPLSLQSSRRTFLNSDNTSFSFVRDMTAGKSWGVDVKKLQVFLNLAGFSVSNAGPGSLGKETTYFGPATKAALLKFQRAAEISGANGRLGPVTRAYINSILFRLWQ